MNVRFYRALLLEEELFEEKPLLSKGKSRLKMRIRFGSKRNSLLLKRRSRIKKKKTILWFRKRPRE